MAHSLSPASPLSGDGGTAFTFYGRAWQASHVIQAQYYRRFNDSRPWRTKNFRTGGSGSFVFRLLDPFAFSAGKQQRMTTTRTWTGRATASSTSTWPSRRASF
jgi:hypothetical protein